MAKLNSDQEKAVQFISKWWASNSMYMVLDGPGGVGKTFIVDSILKKLDKCTPMLLAPTNEALAQLRSKVVGEYTFKTVHSALGITPTMDKKELKFSHVRLPNFWENYNLVTIDEASMLDDLPLELLMSTKVRILYVGHKSQLPPIKPNRSIFDKCESPVFTRSYPTVSLSTPMRNTGGIFYFNQEVEKVIYDTNVVIPSTYDVKLAELSSYLASKQARRDFLAGETKVVTWSNQGSDFYNDKVRSLLHGEKAREHKYILKDKIILTKPLVRLDGLDRLSERELTRLMNSKELQTYYSNAKAEVLACSLSTVSLNVDLDIICYKLLVNCEGENATFYSIVNEKDVKKIGDYYEHLAWECKTPQLKQKAYEKRHFILSCFAEIKHYFAATSHRLQGATIDNIIVINSDIMKNMNKIERSKCRYVATSRASKSLMYYKGGIV